MIVCGRRRRHPGNENRGGGEGDFSLPQISRAENWRFAAAAAAAFFRKFVSFYGLPLLLSSFPGREEGGSGLFGWLPGSPPPGDLCFFSIWASTEKRKRKRRTKGVTSILSPLPIPRMEKREETPPSPTLPCPPSSKQNTSPPPHFYCLSPPPCQPFAAEHRNRERC